MALQYIADWKLTDASTTAEQMYDTDIWQDGQGVMHFDKVLKQRLQYTRTYEATLADTTPAADLPPEQVNPDNLTSPWVYQGNHYSEDLTTPLTKRVQEIYTKYGEWEIIERN